MMNKQIDADKLIIEFMDLNLDHCQGTDGREAVQVIQDFPSSDSVKWIPVSERLPIMNTEWVLTYRPTMGVKMLVDRYEGHYGEDDDEWEEGWVYGRDTVVAWMPLPEPYREDE